MAFVRFSGLNQPHPYESDIYIHPHIHGGYACCGCRVNSGQEFRFEEFSELEPHLLAHQDNGDTIPPFMWLQCRTTPEDRLWTDAAIEEMVILCAARGGKILSWDADVPIEWRDDEKLAEMTAMLTSAQSQPTDSEESSTSHPTEK